MIRDSKLLELREKIENSPVQPGLNLAGRQIPFLFRIARKYTFDFNQCLEAIRTLDKDVYLPLNKTSKELGLKESHQYMFEIFNQTEEATAATFENSSRQSSTVDLNTLELTP